jgi:2-polyprenyl-6-methoxyphenol 4-hydroxylase
MVGLSLALLLAKNTPGYRITVVEGFAPPASPAATALQPSFDARATALSESSRKIFSGLGMWQDLSPALSTITHIDVSDRGHLGAVRLKADDYGFDGLGYVVENRVLGQALFREVQDCEAITLVAPARVERLQPLASGMLLLAGEQRCRAKLAVVADGADSAMLKSLGIESRHQDYHQTALIANIGLSESHNGVAYERFTEEGPVALLPLSAVDGQHRAALVWTLTPERAEQLKDAPEPEFLAALHRRFGYRAGHFIHAGVRNCYGLRLTVAEEQVRRNLLVVGNAAHFLHPVAGQGFNLALRDVARLAQTLASGQRHHVEPGDLALLESYLEAQLPDQQRTIAFSDRLPALFGNDDMLLAGARNLGLVAMDLIPGLRGEFARFGTGLASAAVNFNGR